MRSRTIYIWHSLFALHNINVRINHRCTLYTYYKHYALNNTITWFSERHMSNSSSSLTFSNDRLVSAALVNEQQKTTDSMTAARLTCIIASSEHDGVQWTGDCTSVFKNTWTPRRARLDRSKPRTES